ncbi:MAG: hypothetical protein JO132_12235 [Streptosporangiaceae bacterium]|nr:hypothetical protein [Streptosporangiaceae bacterium]
MLTFTVAAAGPSVMEPALPGRPGQPPWSADAHLSAYTVVGLAAAGLAAGALGLALVLRATRGGWSVSPRAVLAAGLLAAAALTLVPPFGSSDQLSYAAYGRMLITGHDPYTTTPAQLAALGDPVARAVGDWPGAPSVYGPLATGVEALASLAGGTSVRLTVFLLGLANLAAFAATALLLHRMTRGDRVRQLRAAVAWAANPLLLQVLVAGAHVDVQQAVFAVAAVAVMFGPWPPACRHPVTVSRAGLAGALVGLGFAVKATAALAELGLAIALAVMAGPAARAWRRVVPPLAALAAGFAATAGAAAAFGGSAMAHQLSRESDMVSIGSPWRVVRTLIDLAVAGSTATDIVKGGTVVVAAVLAVLLIRGLPGVLAAADAGADGGARARAGTGVVFALVLAWLLACPYVLPWYDALAWALLPLVPLATLRPGLATDALYWALLARGVALGFGYLPARQAGVTLPGGLSWLQPVIRHGLTPAVLAMVTAWLAVRAARAGSARPPAGPGTAPAVRHVPAGKTG